MFNAMLCATAKAEAVSSNATTAIELKKSVLASLGLESLEPSEPLFFVCGNNCENVTSLSTDADIPQPENDDVIVVFSSSDKQAPSTRRAQVLQDCTELQTSESNVDLLDQVTFEEADLCGFCEDPQPFNWGVLGYGANLRHHCRECGRTGCDKHTSKFIPLPLRGLTEPQRVCDACFRANPGVEAQPLLEDDLQLSMKFGDAVTKYHQHASHIVDAARIQHTVVNAGVNEIEKFKSIIQNRIATLQTDREMVKKTAQTLKIAEPDIPQQAPIEQSSITHCYQSPKLSKLRQEFHETSAAVYTNDAECEALTAKAGDYIHQLRQYQQSQHVSQADLEGVRSKDAVLMEIREQFKVLSNGTEFQDKLIQSFQSRKETAEAARAEDPGRDKLEDYLSLEQRAKHDNERDLLVSKQQTMKVAMLRILKASEDLNEISLTKATEVQPLVQSSKSLLAEIDEATKKTKDLDAALLDIGKRHDKLLDHSVRDGTIQYGNVYHKLNQQINRLKQTVEDQKEKIESLTRKNQQLMGQSGDATAQAAIASLQAQLESCLKTIASTRDQKTELDHQVKDLTTQLQALNTSMQGKDEEVNQIQGKLDTMQAENEAQLALIANKEAQLQAVGGSDDASSADHEQLTKELALLQVAKTEGEAQITELKKLVSQFKSEAAVIGQNKEGLEAEIQVLTTKAEGYRNRGRAAESRVVEYHEALHTILESVHPSGHIDYPLADDSPLIQEAKDGVNAFVSRFGVLEQENARLKRQAANLSAEIAALGGEEAAANNPSTQGQDASETSEDLADKISQVERMGFVDKAAIREALLANNFSVGEAVGALLAEA